MRFNSVVLPAPRKPVSIVRGTTGVRDDRSRALLALKLVDDLLELLLLAREFGLHLADLLLDDLADINLEAVREIALRLAIQVGRVVLLRVDLPIADDLLLDVGDRISGIGESTSRFVGLRSNRPMASSGSGEPCCRLRGSQPCASKSHLW